MFHCFQHTQHLLDEERRCGAVHRCRRDLLLRGASVRRHSMRRMGGSTARLLLPTAPAHSHSRSSARPQHGCGGRCCYLQTGRKGRAPAAATASRRLATRSLRGQLRPQRCHGGRRNHEDVRKCLPAQATRQQTTVRCSYPSLHPLRRMERRRKSLLDLPSLGADPLGRPQKLLKYHHRSSALHSLPPPLLAAVAMRLTSPRRSLVAPHALAAPSQEALPRRLSAPTAAG